MSYYNIETKVQAKAITVVSTGYTNGVANYPMLGYKLAISCYDSSGKAVASPVGSLLIEATSDKDSVAIPNYVSVADVDLSLKEQPSFCGIYNKLRFTNKTDYSISIIILGTETAINIAAGSNSNGSGSSGVSSVSITAGDGIAVASTGTASNPAFTITATGGGSGGTSVIYGTDIVKSLVSGDNMSLAIDKASGALTLNSTATGGQTVLFGDKTVKSIAQGANTMLSIDDTGALTIATTSGGTTSSSESVLTCNIPFSTGLTVNYTDSTNAALNMYNIIYYPIDTSTNASCLYSPSELDAGTYDFYLDIDLGNTVNATETTVVANVAVTANISLATIKNGKPDTVIANVAKQALNASTVSYTSNRVLLAKSVVIAADQNDCVLNLTNFTIAAADNFSLGVTGNISLVAIASTATVKKGK